MTDKATHKTVSLEIFGTGYKTPRHHVQDFCNRSFCLETLAPTQKELARKVMRSFCERPETHRLLEMACELNPELYILFSGKKTHWNPLASTIQVGVNDQDVPGVSEGLLFQLSNSVIIRRDVGGCPSDKLDLRGTFRTEKPLIERLKQQVLVREFNAYVTLVLKRRIKATNVSDPYDFRDLIKDFHKPSAASMCTYIKTCAG